MKSESDMDDYDGVNASTDASFGMDFSSGDFGCAIGVGTGPNTDMKGINSNAGAGAGAGAGVGAGASASVHSHLVHNHLVSQPLHSNEKNATRSVSSLNTKIANATSENNNKTPNRIEVPTHVNSSSNQEEDDIILVSMLNKLYDLMERLLDHKVLSQQHIQTPPKWLAKGVLGVAFLEALRRSTTVEGIILSVGPAVTSKTCPPKHLQFFNALSLAKQYLTQYKFHTGDVYDALRDMILFDETKEVDFATTAVNFKAMQKIKQIIDAVSLQTIGKNYWSGRWSHILSLLNKTETPAAAKKPPQKTPELSDIWTAVLNRSYDVGLDALNDKLISESDVVDCEAFLYIGIIGATILDAVKRSMSLSSDAIELASGKVVTLKTCPTDLKLLMTALTGVKKIVFESKLDEKANEWVQLRTVVLWADAENKKEVVFVSPQRKITLNKIAAGIQSIVTQVTQMKFFKDNFGQIMKLLADSCKH